MGSMAADGVVVEGAEAFALGEVDGPPEEGEEAGVPGMRDLDTAPEVWLGELEGDDGDDERDLDGGDFAHWTRDRERKREREGGEGRWLFI